MSTSKTTQLPPKTNSENEDELKYKELISILPRERGWEGPNCHLYQHEGFWYLPWQLQGVFSTQKHFEAQDSDTFLITYPKSGTTWFMAIIFTLLNRTRYPVHQNDHPLLTHNPHDLVPSLELNLYTHKYNPIASGSSPRLFSTHLPYVSLPESVKNNPTCKIVYVCRNPKDTFVSLWHFLNKLRAQEMGEGISSVGECFQMFINGVSEFGPYWDHVLDYWKLSKVSSSAGNVLFLKYEDMKELPGLHLRGLAQFLGCPFSEEEEELGLVDRILDLCSFRNLSGLEVNKKGKLLTGVVNHAFFRKGEVGDWKNYFNAEMDQEFDRVMQHKFHGSGLVL